MQTVYLAGVGMTKFGKSTSTLTELLCQAATDAIASSQIPAVEAVFIGAAGKHSARPGLGAGRPALQLSDRDRPSELTSKRPR